MNCKEKLKILFLNYQIKNNLSNNFYEFYNLIKKIEISINLFKNNLLNHFIIKFLRV